MTLEFLLRYLSINERIVLYQDDKLIYEGMIKDIKYELCRSLDTMYVDSMYVEDRVKDSCSYLEIFCK